MAVLQENRTWMIDAPAQALHQHGLDLEVDGGDFAAAHTAFAAAEQRLESLESTDDVRLQTARITRDDGFTYVREALASAGGEGASQQDSLFEKAESRLIGSMLIAAVLTKKRAPESRRERELFSEYGATIGVLGRMVVAQQVSSGDLPLKRGNREALAAIRNKQSYFGRDGAHGYLKQGSNMYYLVSNAMHGARAERLNGKPAHIAPWLGRAAVGLLRAEGKVKTAVKVTGAVLAEAKTAVREHSLSPRRIAGAAFAAMAQTEFGTAFATTVRIGFSMRTKRAAVASIFSRP